MVSVSVMVTLAVTAGKDILTLSERSCALGACATKSSPHRPWLAAERVGALFAAGEGATLTLEFVHRHSRERGGSVVLRFVLVDFVDGDSVVDDGWLDCLLLDYRLDVLVDMVVDVLARNNRVG